MSEQSHTVLTTPSIIDEDRTNHLLHETEDGELQRISVPADVADKPHSIAAWAQKNPELAPTPWAVVKIAKRGRAATKPVTVVE